MVLAYTNCFSDAIIFIILQSKFAFMTVSIFMAYIAIIDYPFFTISPTDRNTFVMVPGIIDFNKF